jgi:acyl-CoA synthetase (AMP-forming)/AMP-acid ligase II
MSLPRAQAGAQHFADYEPPASISFVDQSLPRNANGKVLKRQLRESPLSENL